MDKTQLDNARKKIDQINREITALLVERLEQLDAVAQWKAANGQPIFVPEREQAILESVRQQAGEKFAGEVEKVFQTIFSVSREREAYLINRNESK
jgi:monofunctional chorismate mutase